MKKDIIVEQTVDGKISRYEGKEPLKKDPKKKKKQDKASVESIKKKLDDLKKYVLNNRGSILDLSSVISEEEDQQEDQAQTMMQEGVPQEQEGVPAEDGFAAILQQLGIPEEEYHRYLQAQSGGQEETDMSEGAEQAVSPEEDEYMEADQPEEQDVEQEESDEDLEPSMEEIQEEEMPIRDELISVLQDDGFTDEEIQAVLEGVMPLDEVPENAQDLYQEYAEKELEVGGSGLEPEDDSKALEEGQDLTQNLPVFNQSLNDPEKQIELERKRLEIEMMRNQMELDLLERYKKIMRGSSGAAET